MKQILKFFGEDPSLADHMGPLHWAVFILMLSTGCTLASVLAWGAAVICLC